MKKKILHMYLGKTDICGPRDSKYKIFCPLLSDKWITKLETKRQVYFEDSLTTFWYRV